MTVLFLGWGAWSLAQDSDRTITRTIDVGPSGELAISNISGDIRIEASSGDTITVEATKTLHGGADPELLDAIDVDISVTGDRVRIETRYPRDRRHRHGDRHGGGVSIDYRLSVPRGTEVEAQSVSGDVTVIGVEGETNAHSVSGDVTIRDAKRLEEAKSVSGDVEVRSSGSEEETEIASVSGEVTASDIQAEELTISSVSGDVRIENASCERGSLESVSGDLVYSGRIVSGGRYEFESHSGDVEITIGEDVGFELEASTFSGDLESDFEMRVTSSDRSGKTLNGVVGDGSAFIEVSTFSGDLELRRR
jgi:DUF4097 and DUF4098 domain-containing protein YvlB